MGGRWLGGGRMGRALVAAACLALCGCAAARGAAPFPVDVDRRDADGSTPFMKAVLTGNRDFAEVLIAHGADVNARDNAGRIPLHYAAANNPEPEATKLLLDAGSDPNARDENGRTPLHVAAAGNRNPGTLKLLLEAGSDPDAGDEEGSTPLHRSLTNPYLISHMDCIAALLEGKPDVNKQDNQGRTPMHVLIMRHYDQDKCAGMGNLLLDAGADPNIVDSEGRTPLHCLFLQFGDFEKNDFHEKYCYAAAKMLIDGGAEFLGGGAYAD